MSISQLVSPKGEAQPFIWYAKSFDGSLLTEFEDDKKENDFTLIDKVNLKEFGLLGRESKMYFLTDDGIINICKDKIDLYIEEEDQKLIKLSGRSRERYNDIIQFKHMYQDFSPAKKPMGGVIIDEFLFGYKHLVNTDKGDIYLQVLFRMPMGKNMEFGFRFASTFNLKGKLFARINGKADPNPIDINIEKGQAQNYTRVFFPSPIK